jgi:two-component system, LytTR family, sensor kinase
MHQPKILSVLVHVVGWLMLFALIIAFATSTPGGAGSWHRIFASEFLIFYGTYIFVFYMNWGLLIPRLYLEKKYFYYFIAIVVLFVIIFFISPFERLVRMDRIQQASGPPPGKFGPPPNDHRDPKIDMISIAVFVMTWAVSTALQIIKQWRTTERRAFQAETGKANAELSFLKAQINPHFLFNTLNNIYSMAVTKSDNTPGAIMKLSNIMRYITDEAANDFVPLKDEVNCAIDYIDLQKMRLSQKMHVDFSVNGEFIGKQIPPLILLTFIENVFKYGISSHEATVITIKLNVDEKNLFFFCQNKIFDPALKLRREGIGISNSEQRLDHLYPGKYLLNTTNENGIYTVQLTLDLQ